MSDPQYNDMPKFLDLTVALPGLAGGGWRAKCLYFLEMILGIHKIRTLCEQAASSSGEHIYCADRLLQMLGITVDSRGIHSAIPKQGGAIVIANHPFGGADAISLCSLCYESRKEHQDTKILANSLVYHLPKLTSVLLPLKILKEQGAKRHNLKTLKKAAELVTKGGLLGVFPAGAVSKHRQDKGFAFTDAPWSEHIARIALKTQAPVIPIRYFGKTPLWFNILGFIYPLIRAAFIPRLLLTMQGQTIRCRAGGMITYQELKEAKDPTAYLRNAVYNISL